MNTAVLIVTHAPLGKAFLDTAKHVFANGTAQVLVHDIIADADPDAMVEQGKQLLAQAGATNGCLILTDVFGATPSNIAKRIATATPNSHFITGLNLPMLLRILNYPEMDASALAAKAVEGGSKSITEISLEN